MAQGDILGFIKNRPGNLIINGAFEFNQRFGTTLNTTPLSYGLDRWFFNAGTSVARVSIANQNFDFAMEAIATAAQNNHIQRIESSMVKHLRGKTVTFSILARITSGAVSAPLRIKTNYANSKDNFLATTQTNDAVLVQKQGNVLDGTFRKFQYSFTVTNEMADNGFEVNFGDFGSATNTLQFAQAMLNESSNAPEFERAGVHYPNEFKLCQRYYERHSGTQVAYGKAKTTGERIGLNYYEPKRTVPVITTLGGDAYAYFVNDTVKALNGIVATGIYGHCNVTFSTSTGYIIGTPMLIRFMSGWDADAEL